MFIFHEQSTADKKVLDKGVWGQHDLVFRQPWLSTISWNTKSDHRQYPRNATTGFLCLNYHHGNTAETSVFHHHLSLPFIHNYDLQLQICFCPNVSEPNLPGLIIRARAASPPAWFASMSHFAEGDAKSACNCTIHPHVYIQLDLLSK